MCVSCGSGIPLCAANGVCASVVQQTVATTAVFGAGLFAVGKDWLRMQVRTISSRISRMFTQTSQK